MPSWTLYLNAALGSLVVAVGAWLAYNGLSPYSAAGVAVAAAAFDQLQRLAGADSKGGQPFPIVGQGGLLGVNRSYTLDRDQTQIAARVENPHLFGRQGRVFFRQGQALHRTAMPGLQGDFPSSRPHLYLETAVLLDAGPEADVVVVPSRTVVAIDGAGGPGDAAFQRCLAALYGAAYGLKFARKAKGGDFKVGPLEGRWWAEGVSDDLAGPPPRDAWPGT